MRVRPTPPNPQVQALWDAWTLEAPTKAYTDEQVIRAFPKLIHAVDGVAKGQHALRSRPQSRQNWALFVQHHSLDAPVLAEPFNPEPKTLQPHTPHVA
jgi:hypothetical protein